MYFSMIFYWVSSNNHKLDRQYFHLSYILRKLSSASFYVPYIHFFRHNKNTIKERLNWSSGKIQCRSTFYFMFTNMLVEQQFDKKSGKPIKNKMKLDQIFITQFDRQGSNDRHFCQFHCWSGKSICWLWILHDELEIFSPRHSYQILHCVYQT